jgi:type IV pilus assembly protein PilA
VWLLLSDHGSYNKNFISKGEFIMKKTNKGFSLVELIIVIAIMAILAGALAPALIKYINKSRVSTDIQTANTIATAVQTALANEAGYDACGDGINDTWVTLSEIYEVDSDDAFKATLTSTIGGAAAPTVKSSKCIAKSAEETGDDDGNFYVYVNKEKNEVKVSLSADGSHMAFPTAVECLTNEAAEECVADGGSEGEGEGN